MFTTPIVLALLLFLNNYIVIAENEVKEVKAEVADTLLVKLLRAHEESACAGNGRFCLLNGACCSKFCDDKWHCATKADPTELSCVFNTDCPTDLCNSATNKCLRGPQEQGASCKLNEECKSGFCAELKCSQKLEVGRTCGTDYECKSGHCVSFTCSPRDCAWNGVACLADSVCCSGICLGTFCREKKLEVGVTCLLNSQCQSNMCNSNTNKCIAGPQANGETCNFNNECKSGFCAANKCQEKLANGQPCGGNAECANGVCHLLFCSSGNCAADSVPCLANSACCSNICIAGKCRNHKNVVGNSCVMNDDCQSGLCGSYSNKCLSGPEPNGKDCLLNNECKSGFCNGQTKKCEDKKKIGEVCGADVECASGVCSLFRCIRCNQLKCVFN
jgi:hypothetical protein